MAAERHEADLAAERVGNEAFEHYRVHGRDAQGRRRGGESFELNDTSPR